MNRLAFFTPLNPMRSGISDYSEELLPYLGRLAEIDLVTDDYTPSTPAISKEFRILRVEQFQRHADRYDAVIYQIGNNVHYHGYMVPAMAHTPGIAVLHDFCLAYLVLGLTIMEGDLRSLKAVVDSAYGDEAGRMLFKLLISAMDPYETPLSRPIIAMNRAVLVHNDYALGLVRNEFPGKLSRSIKMGMQSHDEVSLSREELKAKYGYERDDFILLSAGNQAYNKRYAVILDALELAWQENKRLRYLVMGGGQMDSTTLKQVKRRGLESAIVCTGWLSPERYVDTMRMADALIDIRYPSSGETSASSLRALESGVPLIVAANAFFLELPDQCAIKVPLGAGEAERLAAAIALLMGDKQRREAMGAFGKEYAAKELGLEKEAAAYMDFVAEVSRSRPEPTGPLFPAANPAACERMIVSSVYRLLRVGYLNRHYGARGAIKKIMKELKYRAGLEV